MFLFPNVRICLDVLTTHGNPMSLVFEHYHCAKGEHPGSTKPIDTRNPGVFCGKNTIVQQKRLYVGSKEKSKESPVYLDRLHCTLLHAAPSLALGRKHLEDLPRWLEVSQSSWVSRSVRETSETTSETNTLSWSWTASSGWVLISLGCSPQDSMGTHRFPWNLERQFQCSKRTLQVSVKLQEPLVSGYLDAFGIGLLWSHVWINFVSKCLAPELQLHVSDFPTRQHSEAFDCGSSRQQPRFGRRRTWQLWQDDKTWQDVPIGTLLEPYWNPLGM